MDHRYPACLGVVLLANLRRPWRNWPTLARDHGPSPSQASRHRFPDGGRSQSGQPRTARNTSARGGRMGRRAAVRIRHGHRRTPAHGFDASGRCRRPRYRGRSGYPRRDTLPTPPTAGEWAGACGLPARLPVAGARNDRPIGGSVLEAARAPGSRRKERRRRPNEAGRRRRRLLSSRTDALLPLHPGSPSHRGASDDGGHSGRLQHGRRSR